MQPQMLRFLLPLCLGLATLRAETQNSEIQGFLNATAPANTDTLVSPAFGRPVVWTGTAASATSTRLTVAGSPGWSTNAYAPGADTYYVRVLTGALAGQFLTIASNDATSALVDASGLSLTSVQAGDQLEIAPYWTLGTLYPAAQAGVTFIASASSLVRQTELWFYDASKTGINRAPSFSYYFYNGAWRKTGAAVATSFNSTIVPPDTYILHRNKAAATTLTQLGRVQPGRVGSVIEADATTRQDNYVAISYPLGLTLNASGLAGSAAFATSSSALSHTDELLVFDPAQTGTNRAPSYIYFYFNGGWRKSGANIATDFGDSVVLAAGSGFIVRRAAAGVSGAWNFNTNL